ncbi:Cyclic nucleotide-binding protein [Pseudocohnilembus persalinus]|uniref:Cyclic nucleotide-binding protein n=1 Tax=Pseudocohnilembus persalinus TaxID=266149 RepID=A0A0V0R0P2_PSEPJ|nr:Cyclic nucleotide-binding protein [Pseudocohnilembus persalinus]|eukprot:KRX08143.1 Cyclic nucleotide-binding protein [Pseudocohnilembus persalinus]
MEKIEERMNLKGNKVYFYEVVKLMSYALMLCHIVGSLYFFLAVIEQEQFDSENTWVQELNLESSPVRHQYIESYYWALATMTLIGTKGSTEIETAFCIIMLSWTIGIFAAILSTVSNVYQEQQAKYKDFKKDRDILNSFFEINNLPNDLQGQLQNYLKYKNQGHSEMQANVNFQHLISTFPANLQNLVREKRYSHLIQQFSLLTKNFSQKTIKVLIENLNEEYFMPGQMINKKDEQQKDAKLYLVVNGNAEAVQITHKNCYSSLKLYEPGDFFGQEQFFANQPPIYYIRSSEGSYTTCISIKQSAFIKIISQQGYEEDREKFYIIKDQLKFQDISQLLNNECYLCNQERHSEKNCNLLFYNPNKVNFLAKLSFSHINERNENFLRMGKKFQLLKSLDGLQKYQQFILQDPNLRKYLKILQEYQRILEDQLEQDSIQKFSEQDQSSFEIDNSSSSSDFFDELQQENSGDFERIQSKFIIGDQFGLLAQHKKNESNQSISVVHSQNYNNKQNLSKLENEMDLNGFKNKSKKNMTFKNELNDSFGDVNSQQQQQKNEISPFIIKIQKTKSEEENIIVANQLYQKEQFSNNENQQQQLQQNQQLQKSKQYKKWQSHFKAALSKHLKFVKNLQNEELEIQFNLGLFSKGYQNSLISLNQRNSHLTQKSNSSKVNSQSLSVTNNQQAEERVINSKTSIQEMDENSFSLKSSKSKVSGILKNSLNSKNSQKSKKHKKKKQSQDTYKENGKQKEEIKISLKSHNNFLNDPNYNQLKNYGQFDVSPQNYDSSKNVKNSQDQKEGPRKVTYSTKCLNFGENDNYSKKNIKNKMSSFFIQHSPASQKDRYYFNNKEINNSILQNESQRQQVNNKKNYNFVQKGSYSQKNLFQDSEKDNFSFKYLASRRNAVDKSNIVQNSPYGQFNSNLRHVEEMIKELYFEFQKSQNIQLEKLNENQIAIDQGLHQNEFFIDLDKMMEYQYYFVHNNYTQTLMSYKEAILRKVKRNVIIEKKQPRKKNRGDTKNFMGSNPFKEKNYKF